MLDDIKRAMIGQTICEAGIVNVAGVKHVRFILSDSKEPLLVELNSVIITASSRKPPTRALTHAPLSARIKAG